MHAAAAHLGLETKQKSSAAGRALAYYFQQQPQHAVPHMPRQPCAEMRSAVGRSAKRERRRRRRRGLHLESVIAGEHGEHGAAEEARAQMEVKESAEERELELLRHASHRSHRRRHSIGAPERLAAHLSLWDRHHALVAALRANPGPQPKRKEKNDDDDDDSVGVGVGVGVSSVRVHRPGARSADPLRGHGEARAHSHDAPLVVPSVEAPRSKSQWYADSLEILQAAAASGIPSTPLPTGKHRQRKAKMAPPAGKSTLTRKVPHIITTR